VALAIGIAEVLLEILELVALGFEFQLEPSK